MVAKLQARFLAKLACFVRTFCDRLDLIGRFAVTFTNVAKHQVLESMFGSQLDTLLDRTGSFGWIRVTENFPIEERRRRSHPVIFSEWHNRGCRGHIHKLHLFVASVSNGLNSFGLLCCELVSECVELNPNISK